MMQPCINAANVSICSNVGSSGISTVLGKNWLTGVCCFSNRSRRKEQDQLVQVQTRSGVAKRIAFHAPTNLGHDHQFGL